MRRGWLAAGVLGLMLACASGAEAQGITSWTVNVYAGSEGNAPLVKSGVIPASAAQCNLPKQTVAQMSGSTVRWDDPANPAMDCQWTDVAFFTLTPGANYQGGLAATNVSGTGPESAPRVPFTEPAAPPPVPGAPTGVRFKP